jgi:hypothetical protein
LKYLDCAAGGFIVAACNDAAQAFPVARRPQKKTICLVTEELALSEASGGIGGAFLELATLLAPTHKVTVLYCPVLSLNGVQKAKAIARSILSSPAVP